MRLLDAGFSLNRNNTDMFYCGLIPNGMIHISSMALEGIDLFRRAFLQGEVKYKR